MVEVLRSLAEERGMLSEIASNRLPDRVFAGGMRAVLERRLSRVPPYARPLLHLAAVAGRQLDLPVLRSLDLHLDEWLETCANVAVLETVNQGWRFTHDKLRERLLEELTPERRSILHRQVAELIEQTYISADLDPSRLAYHYAEAGVAELAVRYATMAGEHALREGAIEKSLTYLNDLYRWQDQIHPKTPLALGYRLAGSALLALGRLTESVARFELAWSTLSFPLPRTGEMSADAVREIQAEVAESLQALPLGIDADEVMNSALEAIELASQSLAAFLWLGRHSSAYRIGLIAIGCVRRLGITSLEHYFSMYINYILKLYSLDSVQEYQKGTLSPNDDEDGTLLKLEGRLEGLLLLKRSRWVDAIAKFRSAMITTNEQSNDLLSLFCHLQITFVFYYQGRFEQILTEADAMLSRATSYGSSQYQAWAHAFKALALFCSHQLRKAQSELGYARKNLDRVDDPLCLLLFISIQSALHLVQGERKEARSAADRALSLLDEHGIVAHEGIEAAAYLADSYLKLLDTADSEPQRAALTASLERAMGHLTRLAGTFEIALPRVLLLRGAAALRAGRPRRAQALGRLSLRHARRCGTRYGEARAHHALSRWAAPESATQQRHERAGREILTELGLSWPPQ